MLGVDVAAQVNDCKSVGHTKQLYERRNPLAERSQDIGNRWKRSSDLSDWLRSRTVLHAGRFKICTVKVAH